MGHDAGPPAKGRLTVEALWCADGGQDRGSGDGAETLDRAQVILGYDLLVSTGDGASSSFTSCSSTSIRRNYRATSSWTSSKKASVNSPASMMGR